MSLHCNELAKKITDIKEESTGMRQVENNTHGIAIFKKENSTSSNVYTVVATTSHKLHSASCNKGLVAISRLGIIGGSLTEIVPAWKMAECREAAWRCC